MLCPAQRINARNPVITRLIGQYILNLFKYVEVELLGHDTQVGFGQGKVLVYVYSMNTHLSRRLSDQRRNNTDGRRLSCAVGPQQSKKITGLYGKVDTFEGYEAIFIGLF